MYFHIVKILLGGSDKTYTAVEDYFCVTAENGDLGPVSTSTPNLLTSNISTISASQLRTGPWTGGLGWVGGWNYGSSGCGQGVLRHG